MQKNGEQNVCRFFYFFYTVPILCKWQPVQRQLDYEKNFDIITSAFHRPISARAKFSSA